MLVIGDVIFNIYISVSLVLLPVSWQLKEGNNVYKCRNQKAFINLRRKHLEMMKTAKVTAMMMTTMYASLSEILKQARHSTRKCDAIHEHQFWRL